MYELPNEFEPAAFVGACLEMLSFGVGSIHFKFELRSGAGPSKGMAATVVSYASVELRTGDRIHQVRVGAYTKIAELGILLNRDVIRASLIGPKAFCLEFNDGAALTFADDESGFERYSIYLPGLQAIYV